MSNSSNWAASAGKSPTGIHSTSKMSSPNLKTKKKIATKRTIGFLFNPHAFWVGRHWSKEYKCACINIIPCFTIWIVQPGGQIPRSNK